MLGSGVVSVCFLFGVCCSFGGNAPCPDLVDV